MTTTAQLLQDLFGRVREEGAAVLDGITAEELDRSAGGNNPIGWLVWHTARVQDAQVADVAGRDQVWTAHGWAQRFALPFDDTATGYGQSPRDVARLHADRDLLAGYLEAVADASDEYLATLTDDDLDQVVDDRWDPPVTLGVRLVSVAADDLQHLGQAAYLRGMHQ